MEVPYQALEESDLFVDCVYKSGPYPNLAGEVITKLVPGCPNLGGFRKVYNQRTKRIAYIVLYTSMCELAWPDFLDTETGVLRYYGDNRKAGRSLLDTRGKGNLLLQEVFGELHAGDRSEIPPFLIFKRHGTGRDMRFLGLAAPGCRRTGTSPLTGEPWTVSGSRITRRTSRFSIPGVSLYPRRGFGLSGTGIRIASGSPRAPGGISSGKAARGFTR